MAVRLLCRGSSSESGMKQEERHFGCKQQKRVTVSLPATVKLGLILVIGLGRFFCEIFRNLLNPPKGGREDTSLLLYWSPD